MSDDAFIEQNCQNIKRLIAQAKLREAHKLSLDLLKQFPEDSELNALKIEIEKEVEDRNSKVISNKINELQPLWKEEKYDQIIAKLKPLLLASADNKELIDKLQTAKKLYQKQVEKMQVEFFSKQRKRLEDLLEKNQFEFQSELYILENNNPNNPQIISLAKELKGKLIGKRITEKNELLKSEKYKDIENFVNQLKKIDKENPQIVELDTEIKRRSHNQQITKKNEFIHKSMDEFEQLMKEKNYNDATKVASEIIKTDPGFKKAVKAKKRAEELLYKSNKNKIVRDIIKGSDQLKKSYQENPNDFTKL